MNRNLDRLMNFIVGPLPVVLIKRLAAIFSENSERGGVNMPRPMLHNPKGFQLLAHGAPVVQHSSKFGVNRTETKRDNPLRTALKSLRNLGGSFLGG